MQSTVDRLHKQVSKDVSKCQRLYQANGKGRALELRKWELAMMHKEDAKAQHTPKRRAMSVLKDKLKAPFKRLSKSLY